ncbi:D-alanyl-D-alanine carboxypeptidase [Geodermatophilus sabuli]|uniref:D-alanyl-D-alanine carboxypeptidase n=1 Tax=Geodermatophilus sabuli TaxID=1564158 RepID=A0A7K3W8Y5_9ACTN|nr:D-alanyl-D-alanine carboxypeptidase family protein [Geodermatophilus sabuli]NEK60357.1 D-alanyl-D-alanine carboxypeptidase [Geodermatophilus sabuli]
MRTGPRWRPGRRALSSLSVVAVAAVLVLLPTGPVAASVDGGTTGVPDSPALDDLQERAADVQADLLVRQTRVVEARAALTAAEAAATEAEAVIAAADVELARTRALVAQHASALYRDGADLSALTLLLSGGDPGDVVLAAGYLEVAERHAAAVVAAAEVQRQASVARRAAAAEALATERDRAAQLAVQIQELEAAAAAATGQLEDALADVERELTRQRQAQDVADGQAAADWRARLDQLAAAGVLAPPAAALLDPAAGLPAGLVPVGAAAGGVQPGAAQLPTSLLVLPAETLAAVTAAVDALGAPYASGATGPDAWGCGSLVQAVYRSAGIALPGDQAGLFSATARIDLADLLPGDLVFLGTDRAGLGHVGIAVGPRTVLTADARAGAVVARPLPADLVIAVGRPSLGPRSGAPAPGPEAAGLREECGDTLHRPSVDGPRAWGGYPNGLIPPSAMCPLEAPGHALRCDAAAAHRALSTAYAGVFGTPLCTTDSYRTYAAQVRLYGEKPALAAVPGTSEHGWGLAVDLCGGVESFGTPQYAWMAANAARFGFVHPSWADPGHGREEPWHWEYAGA